MKKRIVILVSVALALLALFSLVSCGSKFTVTVDLAGGTGIDVTEIKVSEGGKIKDPGTPTREGYKFIGWYINDTPKAWDFDNTTVTGDMTIRAAWVKTSGSSSNDVCKDGGEHDFTILEDTKATCKTGGKLRKKCNKCFTTINETFPKLDHDILETVVEATCGAQGYTNKKCVREGCDYDKTVAFVQPTGNHTWSGETNGEYEIIVAPTKYTKGTEREWCLVCPAERTYTISPLYTKKELNALSIGNYLYTGGSYTNAPFVNISQYAGATSSSYYTICLPGNAVDGDIGTYWSADTLADGASFTGEWILLTFDEEREIGAFNFVMPNYTSWELGDDCYVEFKIELLVNGEWINVGTVSDKAGRTEGLNAGCMLELPTPYKTNSVRATVTHSSRFAPAMIYELEVFAHTEKTYREPVSLDGASTAVITGKYSEWATGGAGALTDGDPTTNWWTDWRHREFEFANYNLSFVDEGGNSAIRKITEITFTANKLVGERFRVRYYGLNPAGTGVTWNVIKLNGNEWSTIEETDSDLVTFTIALEKPVYATRLVIECDGYTPEGELVDFNYYKPTLKDVSFKYHDITLKSGVVIPTKTETVDAEGNKKEVDRKAEEIFKDKISPENADESGENVYDKKDVEVACYDAVYADLELPVETFIAAIQFTTRCDEGRILSLQYWVVDEAHPNGHFVEIGEFTVPKFGEKPTGVQCSFSTVKGVNMVTFTQILELNTTKLRLELKKEPMYWESKIYSFTPYTIEEKAQGVAQYSGCAHNVLNQDRVVSPTCTETGYTVMKCNCGYTSKSKATDALGHVWGEYVAVEQLGSNGLKTQTASCQNCDATRSKSFKESYSTVEITQYLKNAPAIWSHTLDDGNYMATYEWAIPVFEKYKFRASMAMAITFADGYASDWQKYFSTTNVFDLVSHSYNHDTIYNVGKVSDSSMLSDVNRAHYWFMNKFAGQRILGFATPNGQTSESAAEYLTGFYYAARIGDSPTQWYNIPSELTNRKMWGRLNSYVSKADQTEGAYTYVKKSEIESLIADVNATTGLNAFVNYMYNKETNRMQDDDRYDGTFWYNAETYVYEWLTTGSYKMHIEKVTEIQKVKETIIDEETGEKKEIEVEKEVEVDKEVYTFVSDNSGEYIMVHSELGSYEKGINTILDVGGWSIDCVHTFGVTNQIWTSYNATISKLEFLKKAHIWGASFTDAIQYIREYQHAHVDITSMTDTEIKISLTDTLDDYMFNHALTVKVDIPDDWTNVTVKQNGIEIPLILDIDEYYDDFARKACTIVDGYLYLDAVPDAGEIVVTVVAE